MDSSSRVEGHVCVSGAERSKEGWMMKRIMMKILTAGGRVVVEVQGFHDQCVGSLHKKTERRNIHKF